MAFLDTFPGDPVYPVFPLCFRGALNGAHNRFGDNGSMATNGLSPERIEAVVTAHSLDEKEGDAATAFALDMINMILERHLSQRETACALELLSHLRHDKCR